jgi:hypothetical protein
LLRASVGESKYLAQGTLFGHPISEVIGVQNVAGTGTSGSPLIRMEDDADSFTGIRMCVVRVSNVVSGGVQHGTGVRKSEIGALMGVNYITVEHPLVISMYLQFVLPRYEFGIFFFRELADQMMCRSRFRTI